VIKNKSLLPFFRLQGNEIRLAAGTDFSARRASAAQNNWGQITVFAYISQNCDLTPFSRWQLIRTLNGCSWPLTDRPFHGAVTNPRNSYPFGTCFASVSPKMSHVVSSGERELLFIRCGSDYPHRFTESKGGQYSGYRPYQQNHKKRIYAHYLTSYVDFPSFQNSPEFPWYQFFK
jgi:hypothetical protein